MSIELWLAVNLLADCALLGATTRALGLYRRKRTLVAGIVCAAFGTLAAARPRPWATPPVQIALLAAVTALLCYGSAARTRRIFMLSLGAAALLCAGLATLTSITGPLAAALCVPLGSLLSALLLSMRAPHRGGWEVRLALSTGGRTVCFEALIDTGNRLREPLSGLPVLVAEAALLRDILPERGYRELRFGALGGQGRMACFRPTGLWIEDGGRRKPAPPVWIAVSPDPLPGICRALAPPEFAAFV